MKKLLYATMAVLLLVLGCGSETTVDHITVTPSTATIGTGETQQFMPGLMMRTIMRSRMLTSPGPHQILDLPQ
uniref:Uncharacterized protein n=1 Tax=candidate division WOR-3 bacterium TaxID=2052148 RepID=A0A7V0Z4M5_UNCW3